MKNPLSLDKALHLEIVLEGIQDAISLGCPITLGGYSDTYGKYWTTWERDSPVDDSEVTK
jgi:hypothetical protein